MSEGKYVVRRVQMIEVDTNHYMLREDEDEWTDEMVIELAEHNYDWGDNTDQYEIVTRPDTGRSTDV